MLTIQKVVNTYFSSNTFIISSNNHNNCWLIDCGDIEKVVELIGGKDIRGVFLTHTHFDHIYGLNRLLVLYPKVCIYTNSFGAEALVAPSLNMSRYHEDVPDFYLDHPNNILCIEDNQAIQLDNEYSVYCYYTPGHDESCYSFIIDKYLFTGDAHIPGVKVFTSFPKSNKEKAKLSEIKIKELALGKQIQPGHTI